MKQQWKQILVWLVVLIVVAAAVYYFLTPAGPYLEGFSYSTAVPLADGKNAIKGLYTIKNPGVNLTDASLNTVMLDVSNICPVSASTMSKACFDELVSRYNLNTGLLSSSYSSGINAEQAKTIMTVLNRQLGTSYSTLDAADVGYAMSNDVVLSGLCTISATGTISVACYNRLILEFGGTPAAPTSTPVAADTTTTKTAAEVKKGRIDTFMAIADVAGYTDLDKDEVGDAYDDLKKSCGKTKASFDRECYNDLAKKLDITIFSSSTMDEEDEEDEEDDITTTTASTKTKTDASKSDISGGSYSAKCTVQFGNDLVTPQTKAATEKPVDKTCDTTGTVSKTTKTPAVEQGCEFTQKFPKVNVINLRDYVHKDEIPCWSCKL